MTLVSIFVRVPNNYIEVVNEVGKILKEKEKEGKFLLKLFETDGTDIMTSETIYRINVEANIEEKDLAPYSNALQEWLRKLIARKVKEVRPTSLLTTPIHRQQLFKLENNQHLFYQKFLQLHFSS
jgi:hypothetical protein